MKDGPGLTCLYKDGESQNFEASEVEQMMAEGWADSPAEETAEPDMEIAVVGEGDPAVEGTEDLTDPDQPADESE